MNILQKFSLVCITAGMLAGGYMLIEESLKFNREMKNADIVVRRAGSGLTEIIGGFYDSSNNLNKIMVVTDSVVDMGFLASYQTLKSENPQFDKYKSILDIAKNNQEQTGGKIK